MDFGFCICEMERPPPQDACFLESFRGHPVTWGVQGVLLHWEDMVNK